MFVSRLLLLGLYRDSQEWVIAREVQEIRLVGAHVALFLPRVHLIDLILFSSVQGIVGTSESCKSALIGAFHEGVVEMGEDEPSELQWLSPIWDCKLS